MSKIKLLATILFLVITVSCTPSGDGPEQQVTAEEQAIINTDNLDGKTKALNSAIEGLAITIGTQLLPATEDSVSFFTNHA